MKKTSRPIPKPPGLPELLTASSNLFEELKSRCDAAEPSLPRQLQPLLHQLTGLRELLGTLQHELRDSEPTRGDLLRQVQHLITKVDSLRRSVTASVRFAQKVADEVQQLRKELQEIRNELTALRKQHVSMVGEFNQMKGEYLRLASALQRPEN